MSGQRSWWKVVFNLPLRYKIIVPVIVLELFVFAAAMRVTTTSVRSVANRSMHAEARSRLRLLGSAYLQMTLTGEQEYFRELVNVVSRAPDVVSVELRPVEGQLPMDTMVERPDGTRLYTAWQRVQVFGDATDIGISYTDRGVILAVSDARTRYGWILGIGVLLTTIVLWVMIFAITDPVTRVAEAADRLAAGEEPPKFDISRRDEVGTLAHAFDTMAEELYRTRTQLETMLAERTRRLEAMFSNLPVGVLQIDADRTVRAANPAMAEMLGLREDEIVGRRCFQLVGDERHFCEHCLFNRDDIAITRHTRTLRRGTRNERILDTTIVRVPGTNGNDPTVLELAHDVTEERRLEAQLIQSSKLASIGQLASGLAHEINNPLGTILLRTDSLLADVEEQGLPDGIRDDAEAIQRQASRVSRITEELLTFSRCTNVARSPVDINAVIDSAMVIVGLRAEKHVVKVERTDIEPVPPVYGNATQLEQVVVNLLANAIDASRPDSVVTVGARTVREETDCPVEIRVEDFGAGIAEDELEHIFDPFYSTKDVGEGTGLGLSISYGIVTAHDGTISVSSRCGEGTIVRVRLPRLNDTELEIRNRGEITAERVSTA